MKMSHRERVIAALSHQQPDRIPLDLGGTRDSSIVVEGYNRLREHFDILSEPDLTSLMMRVVDVDESILQALDIDTRGVFPGAPAPIWTDTDRYVDDWGVERVKPSSSFYYDQVSFPLAGDVSVRDVVTYPWPEPGDSSRTAGLRSRVETIHRPPGYAAVLNLPSAFVHTSQYLRGFEDWFTDLAMNRTLIEALFDAVLEVSLSICRVLLEEVGREVDVVLASDDLGFQQGLMVSPEMYRALIKPRHQRYFQLIHEMTDAKLLFHTCGSVVDIIDDLIEIGVEALHPVQVSAAGMDPAMLKQKYGDRLSFWGAVDTHHVLPHGDVDDVTEEVELRIEQLGREGGYVLGAVHNIQPDVPLENILAMYGHARLYSPSFLQ